MNQDIRAARAQDAAAIAEIYNQGIEDRLATLETALRDAAERRAWLAARTARTPVFVAVAGDHVLGFASLNAYSPRECYRFVADFLSGRIRRRSQLIRLLSSAIIAFAKRQLTWFRRMERRGTGLRQSHSKGDGPPGGGSSNGRMAQP